MKKRLVAFFCALALLAGLMPAGTVAAVPEEATAQQYLVGYAIQSINPDDSLDGKLQLTGNGNDSSRYWDGTTDENGGIFATCVCITDYKGNTVMIISVDMCKGYDSISNNAQRQGIIDALNEHLATKGKESTSLSPDQIIITASHTHSGPNTDTLDNYVNDNENPLWKYYEDIQEQLKTVAINAYLDRKPATMKRGAVDAKEATKQLYKKTGFEGYEMNFIRQYTLNTTYSDGSTKKFMIDNAVGRGNLFGEYTSAKRTRIYEADHTMHLLTFEFDESANKEPIVMLNWSAHPTSNSGSAPNAISSDYVGALRKNLADMGYRAAFIQGAGANTTIASAALGVTDWTEKVPSGGSQTEVYGEILAKVAKYGIDNNMTDALPAREITNLQRSISLNRQDHGEEYYTAATEAKNSAASYPYKASNGVVINFSSHKDQILNRYDEITKYGPTRAQTVNVISLGHAALFVTSPSEMADYYNTYVNGELAEFYAPDTPNESPNKWNELVNDATYDAPFVISNANGNNGYMPNAMSYDYNKEYNGSNYTDAEDALAPGSYEANTSYFARGSGEKLLDAYKEMIAEVDKKVAYCDACNADVTWTPVYAAAPIEGDAWETGHYYLRDDLTNYAGGTLENGEKICIDLNGKQITCKNRFFASENESSGDPGILNIVDSQDKATVTSSKGFEIGGLFFLQRPFTLNIYGGTFASNGTAQRGGIAFVHGTFNLHNGTIIGSDVYEAENVANSGRGGALHISNHGKLHVYGGNIIAKENASAVVAPCVYMLGGSTFTLCGDANIENVCFKNDGFGNTVSIPEPYTGTVDFTFLNDSTDAIVTSYHMDIGNIAADADISAANITVNESNNWKVVVDSTDLRLDGFNEDTVALIGYTEYSSLTDALNAYTGTAVKLVRDVAAAVNVAKDAHLDLNGCDITGALTIANGKTLYCLDSQTDDYTVEDGKGYGKLTSVSAEDLEQIKGVDRFDTEDSYGYLKVTETGENAGVSFHRVCLDLTHINLRAEKAGIYYKSAFAGDEVVAKNVKKFGVAMSIIDIPTEENLEEECEYSKFNGSLFREGSGTSTIVINIMKEENGDYTNFRNANIKIYGRAYILTDDGYVFGLAKARTLKETIVAIDGIWNKLEQNQKDPVLEMYHKFENVMKTWNLENISAGA